MKGVERKRKWVVFGGFVQMCKWVDWYGILIEVRTDAEISFIYFYKMNVQSLIIIPKNT